VASASVSVCWPCVCPAPSCSTEDAYLCCGSGRAGYFKDERGREDAIDAMHNQVSAYGRYIRRLCGLQAL
jgi:hypothetical protein